MKKIVWLIIAILSFKSAAGFTIDNISYISGYSEGEVMVNGISSNYMNSEFMIPEYVSYLNKSYNVVGINNFACKNNSSLTYIGIPSTVESIGGGAFWGCSSLQYCTIENGVTQIWPAAFYKCSNLYEIDIPASVTFMAGTTDGVSRSHFYGCALNVVKVHYQYPNEIDDSTFDGSYSSATLYVPIGTKYLYENTNGWKLFNKIEEDADLGKYYVVKVSCGENGVVEFIDKTASIDNNIIWNVVPKENVIFNIIPNDGYSINKVVLNGEDVTSDIVENILEINEVNSDIVLDVSFKDNASSLVNVIDINVNDYMEIFSLTGIKLFSGIGFDFRKLTPGIYIVKTSNCLNKVLITN